MRSLGSVFLALLVSTLAAVTTSSSGIRWDWTPAEVACAETTGVKLGTSTDPGSPSFVAHLTWLSDVVVVGVVSEIKNHLTGDFPAAVIVNVSLVKKGENVPNTIEVVLNGGPHYSSAYKKVVQIISSSEPTFSAGETVYLFLTGNSYPAALAGHEQRTLAPGQFALVDGAKFTVASQTGAPTATYDVRMPLTLSLQFINAEIDTARKAQAALCQ